DSQRPRNFFSQRGRATRSHAIAKVHEHRGLLGSSRVSLFRVPGPRPPVLRRLLLPTSESPESLSGSVSGRSVGFQEGTYDRKKGPPRQQGQDSCGGQSTTSERTDQIRVDVSNVR